jgi:hypothetical protein
MLQEYGVVGPPDGSKPRDVLMDRETLERLRFASQNPDEDFDDDCGYDE